MKDHERGDIVKIDWLDRLAFRQIEQVHQRESAKSDELYLYVDLPRFDFPVVFSEQVRYTLLSKLTLTLTGELNSSASHAGPGAQQSTSSDHVWSTFRFAHDRFSLVEDV